MLACLLHYPEVSLKVGRLQSVAICFHSSKRVPEGWKQKSAYSLFSSSLSARWRLRLTLAVLALLTAALPPTRAPMTPTTMAMLRQSAGERARPKDT